MGARQNVNCTYKSRHRHNESLKSTAHFHAVRHQLYHRFFTKTNKHRGIFRGVLLMLRLYPNRTIFSCRKRVILGMPNCRAAAWTVWSFLTTSSTALLIASFDHWPLTLRLSFYRHGTSWQQKVNEKLHYT